MPIDAHLSQFNPLERIICFDDFDNGLSGWVPLLPNMRPDAIDYYPEQKYKTLWGGPMLSTATFPFLGSHGSMNGVYSMKIPSRPIAGPVDERPRPGSMGHAIKRLTVSRRSSLRFEMWYTYAPEHDRPGIGEEDIRSFGFAFDIQDNEKRYFAGVRYLNSAGGKMRRRWQLAKAKDGTDAEWGPTADSTVGYKNSKGETERVWIKRGIDPSWLGTRHADGSSDSFLDIPNSEQYLCYNESVDKINWHYLSLTIDLASRRYVSFTTQDQDYDISDISPTLVDAYPRINNLVNPILWVETNADRRAMLFVDSLMVSTGEERSV